MAAGEVKGSCGGRPPPRDLLPPSLRTSGLGSWVPVAAARVEAATWALSVPCLVSICGTECCRELPGPLHRKSPCLRGSQVCFWLRICRRLQKALSPVLGSFNLYYLDDTGAQEPNLVFGVRPPWAQLHCSGVTLSFFISECKHGGKTSMS